MSSHSRHRTLCWIYGLIAVGALIATWIQNIRFLQQDDDGGLSGFVDGAYANPASSSMTNDLMFIFFGAVVFMVVESRRLGIRHLWAYLLGSLTIAGSVAFPLFLLMRERKLAELEDV